MEDSPREAGATVAEDVRVRADGPAAGERAQTDPRGNLTALENLSMELAQ